MRRRLQAEAGVALLIAVMSMMLMAALGSALVLTTLTEAGVASNYAAGVEAFYAADGAVTGALADLPAVADWSTLTGVRFDGPVEALMTSAPAGSHLRVIVTIGDAAMDGAIVVRARASGTRGVLRILEATVMRTGEPGPAGVRLVAWREVR